MTKLKTLIIGAGDRGSKVIHRAKDHLMAVAVAEPNSHKREKYAKKHGINQDQKYNTGEEALNAGLDLDMVYVASPDKTHRDLAVQALGHGYNILLEKPMATTEQDCRDIIEAQKQSGSALSVCHVLRYTPFFTKIKEITQERELGELQGIDLTEEVGHWHYAHSYVRGNWRKESESSPLILAKSCHDLDIMVWLANSKAKSIISQGSLDFFQLANAPEGSLERCTLGCPIKDCIYDARDFYVGEHIIGEDGNVSWPYAVMSDTLDQKERIAQLQDSPYGKCVFRNDNDVCDNQDVSIEFKNNVKANFRLRYHGESPNRIITVNFSKGNILGNFAKNHLEITRYGKSKKVTKEIIDLKNLSGHGGGDNGLVRNFVKLIRSGDPTLNKTSAELSLQSHLMAFAAEKSRKSQKTVFIQ